MSLSTGVDTVAMPLRAVSLRARAVWMVMALLPGLCLEASVPGIAWAGRIACVMAGFSAIDWIADRASGVARSWDPQPLLMSAIVFCWLPASMPWELSMMAAAVAWILARSLGRMEGGSAFHPAMIGCAAALLLSTDEPRLPTTAVMPPWIAVAFAIAGMALAAGRCIRWQLPLAVWMGAAFAWFSWQAFGLQRPADEGAYFAFPAFQVAAFFVATDPSGGCQSPRARWAFGLGVGVLGMLALSGFHDGRRGLLGMAGAIVLMNAAAPWLDRMLPSACRSPRRAP